MQNTECSEIWGAQEKSHERQNLKTRVAISPPAVYVYVSTFQLDIVSCGGGAFVSFFFVIVVGGEAETSLEVLFGGGVVLLLRRLPFRIVVGRPLQQRDNGERRAGKKNRTALF